MSAFIDAQDILGDFLVEARELLDEVDVKLVELEGRPNDAELLNTVFRGFHTVKGGAGFLEVAPLVELCHKSENLLGDLRTGKLSLSQPMMDAILEATGEVRRMFGDMEAGRMPEPSPATLLAQLVALQKGEVAIKGSDSFIAPAAVAAPAIKESDPFIAAPVAGEPDWKALLAILVGEAAPVAVAPVVEKAAAKPAAPARAQPVAKENSLRIDTSRFDQILNLSGEIGLTRNRLGCLRKEVCRGTASEEALRELDAAVSQLDALVGDLQSVVMKARMQPVGRVFQKYNRLARDLARSLGKEVDLEIVGEETEVDKTILDELNDPLVHLVRNAIDHGVEMPAERVAKGKDPKAKVRIAAYHSGDSIVVEISDDGKGIRPEVIRAKAIEKGLLDATAAASMDDRQSLNLIFLPGFSTKDQVSDLSGRGVGMDVVMTNITRLRGRVDIDSTPERGSRFVIRLPLTLAILPVLTVRLGKQPFGLPLSAVREIVGLDEPLMREVGGTPCVSVRGEILPLIPLAGLLGRTGEVPAVGVVVTIGDRSLVLGVDGFLGQDEVMIKPIAGVKPRGVAGATLSGDGRLVLLLELSDLIAALEGAVHGE
ncbi:chemotaxis protein CheA [Betaproteobacteria bacterium GR16-43]|nr:chemotaxis protein CheA [Betaproteobacteria bacterium GR16-43]